LLNAKMACRTHGMNGNCDINEPNTRTKYTYDSFGNVTNFTGTLRNPFQYAARESDPETGLYYNRARYYNPSTGRFLSEDPIGFLGGINFYRYVFNNPANLIDPTGYQAATGVGCVLGGPGGCAVGGVIDVADWLIPAAVAGMAYYSCKQHHCEPCVPPVGTIAYRIDTVPPSRPHWPQTGTHWHLYQMNQNPNNCQCFWKDLGKSGDGPPPPGSVPIGPPGGGGPR
jgi:RHS repeat-associated protein